MKQMVRKIAQRMGFDLRRYRPTYSRALVSLKTSARERRGSVLIAYHVEPFLEPQRPVSTAHSCYGESFLMVEAWLQLGFDVDIIDYRHGEFQPRQRYDVLVSARTHLEHLADRLDYDVIKIAHLDTSHYLFNNHAAYARALALQQRRGTTCLSVRIVEDNLAIEHADFAAILGGGCAAASYAYADKPLYRLPAPTVAAYPFNAKKKFADCRRRFLWFGSSGLVHKGLDLVLEAFADMPQYELVVCGPIGDDIAFSEIYRRELYELPNIHTIGWVDVTSLKFQAVARDCVALVFPTCAEGLSVSSITCMHAGLIPIVSPEAGITVEGCGRLLRESSIAEIKQTVAELAHQPTAELQDLAYAAWEEARTRHTKERYAAEYQNMLMTFLSAPPSSPPSWQGVAAVVPPEASRAVRLRTASLKSLQ